MLTQSIGTPEASAPAGNCVQLGPTGPTTASCPQSAGVTSTPDSSILTTTFTGLTITCPVGMPTCTGFSNPLLQNNLIWQNRSFQIGIGGFGAGNLNQQKIVSLFDAFTGRAAPVQAASGACATGVSYWDIGVRGDRRPNDHTSGYTLNPTYSFLDDPGDYPGTTANPSHNLGANPSIVHQYCNGSRVPPECTVADGCAGPNGYAVPPGIVDASTPNPVFSLTPSATVDEGNNWINVSWGPLALSNDAVTGGANGNYGGGAPFANYALNTNSPAIDYVPIAQTHPTTDFFGNPRPDPANTTRFDVGAIEFQGAGTGTAQVFVSPTSLVFTHVYGTAASTTPAQTLTVTNGTAAGITGLTVAVATNPPFSRSGGTCAATLAAGASCTINISFAPPTATTNVTFTGTVTITSSATVAGSPVSLTGEGLVAVPAASVTPSSLVFANQADGSTSAAQTLTVTNTGNVALAGGTFTFGGGTPEPFARAGILQGGPGTCGATLALNATCTYNVVFTAPVATASTSYSRTLTVAYTGATVTGSPVSLTGTGIPVGTLSFTAASNGALSTVAGVRTLTFTIPTPRAPVTSTVTVTNTGGGTLQITAETLTLNIGALYSITGTTCSFTTPLAPAGTCTVSIHYATPATRPGVADVGLATFANNGSGTVLGVTGLALVAQ